MRLRLQSRRSTRDEQSILPLTNIVFLLLIFFMLAGRLSASDPFGVQPPLSASDTAPGHSQAIVWVGADGRLALDDTVMDATAIGAALAERLSDAPETWVEIRADGRVEAVRAVAVIERLRDAGVTRLRLLTVPDRR